MMIRIARWLGCFGLLVVSLWVLLAVVGFASEATGPDGFLELRRSESGGDQLWRNNYVIKMRAVEMINEIRVAEGLEPVTLGRNDAAQRHAESSVGHCGIISHWDWHGLKPYMRYSLAGGYQFNGENIYGYDGCAPTPLTLVSGKIEVHLAEANAGFLDSPGHRETLLDKDYRRVNLGIAWTATSFRYVQHFETDSVRFQKKPSLQDGVLSFRGTTKGVPDFSDVGGLVIYVSYDAPIRSLSDGQLARTYAYDTGLPAGMAESFGGYQHGDQALLIGSFEAPMEVGCPDPYAARSGSRGPETVAELEAWTAAAKTACDSSREATNDIPLYFGANWLLEDNRMDVEWDLNDILSQHGPGVYTIALYYVDNSSEDLGVTALGMSSLFHDLDY